LTAQYKPALLCIPRCLAQIGWKEERQRILDALSQYNGERRTGRKYFIAHNHGVYPPKDVRSIVEGGRSKSEFSGVSRAE